MQKRGLHLRLQAEAARWGQHLRGAQPPRQASKALLGTDVGAWPQDDVQPLGGGQLQVRGQVQVAAEGVAVWAGLVQAPVHVCGREDTLGRAGVSQGGS